MANFEANREFRQGIGIQDFMILRIINGLNQDPSCDIVPQRHLWHNIELYGITVDILRWIEGFLFSMQEIVFFLKIVFVRRY